MKSRIFLSIIGVVASMSLVPAIFAETTTSDATPNTTVMDNPLLVESITPVDDMHVHVVFNQDILKESVRVRIAKQSDESSVRIDSFTGGSDSRTVAVSLTETLGQNTAYKMTIISAISQSGVIIKDGADALKEFTTPVDLKKFAPTLNAPSNPNAVMVGSGAQSGSTTPKLTPTNTQSGKTASPVETAKELPLTGVDSTLFIALAAGIALLIVLLRRRHA